MAPLELANKYMEIFYRAGSIDSLTSLFADNFTFKGPFYEFNSAAAYIASLKQNPPKGLDYKIIQSYQNESSACLVYEFSKPGVSATVAQTFEVEEGKISKILLIFNTADFKN